MRSARKQAENYARALDEWPPFLVIVDVGHSIELYADFSLQGKNYAQFPDRNTFRISLAGLDSPDARSRLRAVWSDPQSLDPARYSAKVTSDIAAFLGQMSKKIEQRNATADSASNARFAFDVSKFLMRSIFAMFAEGIGLLPKFAFLKLIESHKGNAHHFHTTADQFFAQMDKGISYSPLIQAKIREFNGGLFRDAASIPINEDELLLLAEAARCDWKAVEPAIFGTLLEQALSERERSQLGAHYTPRSHVERLVVPTIIEPLRDDWEMAQSSAIGQLLVGDENSAREIVRKFHDALCDTHILDPACGTGNFLYVSLELMKRLEGEVLDFLKEIGEGTEPLRTVDPHQFIGIEFNPRAVPIAELVLWIGYIQWWFRTRDRQVIAEPILRDFGTIRSGDAVLATDKQELLRDSRGEVVVKSTRLRKPDSDGSVGATAASSTDTFQFVNPHSPKWPDATFIVGNPPFIGARRIRDRLGDPYVEALRKAYPDLPQTIDYVMYWWAKAAQLVCDHKVRRAGLITTNSIVQDYSRPVLEYYVSGDNPKCTLVYGVTNHPWVDTSEGAAVKIAMTVVANPDHHTRPRIGVVTDSEAAQDTISEINIDRINSSLRPIPDILSCGALKSNSHMCLQGVVPAGDGFKIAANDAARYADESVVKPYIIGNDIADRWSGKVIVDAFGLTSENLRRSHPKSYQLLLATVRSERQKNRRKIYRDNWWVFAEPRPRLRRAISGLRRYIGTPYTASHRVFTFVESHFVPDAMVYVIPSDDPYLLGVLTSEAHGIWCRYASGTLEDRPRYNSKRTFYPFPFPAATESQKTAIRELAEELDSLRKQVLSQNLSLTMTKLYNVRKLLKTKVPLSDEEDEVCRLGCVSVIDELHLQIDQAVNAAYGWRDQVAEDDALVRLVALNKQRALEERRGIVRYLRTDYQEIGPADAIAEPEQFEVPLEFPEGKVLPLPKDDAQLVATLRAALRVIGRPVEPDIIAGKFRDGARATKRVEHGLRLLAAAGVVRRSEIGWFLPKERVA